MPGMESLTNGDIGRKRKMLTEVFPMNLSILTSLLTITRS